MSFLRKLGIWVVSLILSICLFSLIFGSFAHISIKEAVGDIYEYADDDVKTEFSSRIDGLCVQLKGMEDKLADAKKQAADQGKSLDELIDLAVAGGYNLDDIDESDLKRFGLDESDVREIRKTNSGNNGISNKGVSNEIDMMNKYVSLCETFYDEKTPKKEFFLSMMDTFMPGGLPELDDLDNKDSPLADNPITGITSKIKTLWKVLGISLPVFILILLGLLFLFFMHEPKRYLRHIAKMVLRTGIWLVIPFIILLIWTAVNPIDTTPLMQLMVDGLPIEGQSSGLSQPDLDEKSAFFMMLPIVLKQLYPLGIFLIGIFFILLGTAGVLWFKLLNKDKSYSETPKLASKKQK